MSSLLLLVAALLTLVGNGNAATNPPGWPSLHFDFTLKRSTVKVYGQSAFAVIANPNVSPDLTSVLYDAFAAFKGDKTSFSYSLVDGIAYVSENNSAHCLDSDALPPINGIAAALNEATAISNTSTSGSSIECSSGKLLKASVEDFDFIVCYLGSSGFTMHGSDMDINVKFLENRQEILVPTVKTNSPKECVAVASSSSLTSLGSALLTGKPIDSIVGRKLEAAFDISGLLDPHSSTCKCRSTPRPCVFIHGLGVRTEEPDNLDNYPDYWGNLTDHAPCCSSMKFAALNTVNNSWTDDLQQQKVCDRVLAVSESSRGNIASDTIIITHSMGGLMLAGAIATEKCSLDESSSWVAISSPMKGSMASDYFQKSCKGETNVVYEKFVNSTGLCPADDGIMSLAYEGESYASVGLIKAYKAAQQVYRDKVYALMCSNGFSGLPSDRQWAYWVLGSTVPHKSKQNDGMVEFTSCASGFPKANFGNSYKNRFYVTKLNHGDMAFRNGDAALVKSKMPVKWFECLL